MFDFLLFLYFFTLHADQLSLPIGGMTVRLNNLIALFLFSLLFLRFRNALFRIDHTLLKVFGALALTILVSFALSDYKARCFTFLIWFAITALFYFFLPYFLFVHYDRHKILNLYVLSFLCVGLYALFQLVFSLVGFSDPFAQQFIYGSIVRPDAFAYEPSYYGLYMTPFIVLLNYHFLAHREKQFYIVGHLTYFKMFAINALYFISTSTSTIFAFAVFCFLSLFVADVRRALFRYSAVLFSGFGLLMLCAPFLMRTYFLKFFYSGLGHGSFYERWVGIENGWQMFLRHPWFGVGFGGYPGYFYDAFLRSDPAFTYVARQSAYAAASNPLKFAEATNVLTEVLASVGIFGTAAFVALIVVILRRGYRGLHKQTFGFLMSVLVMLVVLQFNQGVLRTYIWFHLGLSFAVFEASCSLHRDENFAETTS